MRTRNVRTGARRVQVSLDVTEIKAIFAAINTADTVTAGVVEHQRFSLVSAIAKLERSSGVDRCSIEEWTLTADGEKLPTVQYARNLMNGLA
jgi:hypothetical protein